MAHWNRRRIAKQYTTMEECVARGLQHLVEAVACLREQGRTIVGKDEAFLDELPRHVETAITTLYTQDPLKQHTIIAAEHEFIDFGNARPDVISRDPNNELVVDDYKCKFGRFDLTWLDKEFDKHFDGEQRMAYTQMAGASLFGIILVVIQPHVKGKGGKPQVTRRVSRVQQNEVALWRNDASSDYERMAHIEGKSNPWMVWGKAGPHANQYGECVYREACVEENLDYGRMRVRYVQILPQGGPNAQAN